MSNALWNPARLVSRFRRHASLLPAVFALLSPAFAHAQNSGAIESVLCTIFGDIAGPTGLAIATTIMIALGVGVMIGKVNWQVPMVVFFGFALMFGAGSIVSALGGDGFACGEINLVPQTGNFETAAIDFCNNLFYPNGTDQPIGNAFAAPLIQCFTDPNNGIIPSSTYQFLTATQAVYIPAVGILATLTVAVFGFRLMAGAHETQRLSMESFTLLFKIAGVFFFLTEAPAIYNQMLTVLIGLGDTISNASESLNPGGFCNTATGPDGGVIANDLWGRWDCILGFLLNFSQNTAPTGGIAAFLFQLFFSSGLGVAAFFLGAYMILALIFSLARFLHIYLMSVLGLSFLFLLGYIFVPLILFRATKAYFDQWFNITFTFVLMPVVMLGYMGMMLLVLDSVMYSGPDSLWNTIDPNAGQGVNAFVDAATHKKDQFLAAFYPDYGNKNAVQQDQVQTVNAGMNGNQMRLLKGVTATQLQNQPPATAPAVGIDTTAEDTDALGGATYVNSVVTSLIAAGLLIYVMYSLLSYIPQMTAGLVAQGTSAGAIGRGPVFGEIFSNNLLQQTRTLGGEAARGGASMVQSAVKSMAGLVTGRGSP